MLKILPVGEQNFSKIRQNNNLYVDKTKQILQMIENSTYYFLSRPRRFGKSLTISTLEAMFKGKAELFKGLYAEKWVKKQTKNLNPIIKLDMSNLDSYETKEKLNKSLVNELKHCAYLYKLDIDVKEEAKAMFKNVIYALYEKFGLVVILIDEYDFPITEYIDDPEKAKEIRDFLRLFYLTLKGSSEYLRFVFITGITKFSKVGIFSGLNNLNDISMDKKYADIVGYTQQELENNFTEWIEKTSKELEKDKEKLLKQIKSYYDGFSFDGITKVYNPFSVLNFFDKADFRNYWYNSSTPSFLVKYLKKHNIKNPKTYINKEISIDSTNASEIETASVENFLFQAGYLTVFKRKGNVITLDYPNEEVRSSMYSLFLENFYNIKNYATISDEIWEALQEENIQKIVNIFNQGLKPIPYEDYSNRNEAWYRDLFLMLLSSQRILYFAEVHTYLGRSDVVIVFDNKIIVIEFKFAINSRDILTKKKEGLNQIKSRDYASPYEGKNKKIITAVFVANDEERQIVL